MPMIARGVMLGLDQPIILHMLDIPPAAEALNGVKMELVDAAFPLLKGIRLMLTTFICPLEVSSQKMFILPIFGFVSQIPFLIIFICVHECILLCVYRHLFSMKRNVESCFLLFIMGAS